MTKDKLVTVREGVSRDEAKRLLHQHRIENCLWSTIIRCVGLITVKDIEKASRIRTPARMSRAGCASRRQQGGRGRLRAPNA